MFITLVGNVGKTFKVMHSNTLITESGCPENSGGHYAFRIKTKHWNLML